MLMGFENLMVRILGHRKEDVTSRQDSLMKNFPRILHIIALGCHGRVAVGLKL
jgi:hypothetical protein